MRGSAADCSLWFVGNFFVGRELLVSWVDLLRLVVRLSYCCPDSVQSMRLYAGANLYVWGQKGTVSIICNIFEHMFSMNDFLSCVILPPEMVYYRHPHYSLKLHISGGITARLLWERSNFSSDSRRSQICKGIDENALEFNFNCFTFGGKDGNDWWLVLAADGSW